MHAHSRLCQSEGEVEHVQLILDGLRYPLVVLFVLRVSKQGEGGWAGRCIREGVRCCSAVAP